MSSELFLFRLIDFSLFFVIYIKSGESWLLWQINCSKFVVLDKIKSRELQQFWEIYCTKLMVHVGKIKSFELRLFFWIDWWIDYSHCFLHIKSGDFCLFGPIDISKLLFLDKIKNLEFYLFR